MNAAIARDPATRWARVTVAVHDGVVTLHGSADSSSQREALQTSIAQVPGVKDVVLAIELPPAYQHDEALGVEIRRRLDEDPRLDASRIQIHVDQRVVTLTGLVPSVYQFDAAVADAWAPATLDVDPRGLRVDLSAFTKPRKAPSPSPSQSLPLGPPDGHIERPFPAPDTHENRQPGRRGP